MQTANIIKFKNSISSVSNVKGLLAGVRKEILNTYDAEMATIYLVDSTEKEIFSWTILPGTRIKNIRIPINKKSIAGYVAQSKKIINIEDVYNRNELLAIDPALSFDSTYDRKNGTRTRQVLAVPILFKKSLLGVIQLINKKSSETFTLEEQKFLYDLTLVLGSSFNNLYKLSKCNPSKYELLIKKDLISRLDFIKAQNMALRLERDLSTVLLQEFGIPKREIGNSLAWFYEIEFVDLNTSRYNPVEYLKGTKIDYFRQTHCIPLYKKDDKTILAIDDPHDQIKIHEIMQVLRTRKVEFRIALKEDIIEFIDRIKSAVRTKETRDITRIGEKSFRDILEEMNRQKGFDGDQNELTIEEEADNKATVLLVRKIIEDAFSQNASDIHIEPYGFVKDAEVRYRIDGYCKKILDIPKNHIRAVVSRLKILSHLDISERRQPQDGKINFKTITGKDIELRISTIPTADGNEDVVLRLLADSEPLPLSSIMPRKTFKPFSQLVQRPYGIVLVVGPTGSGKTTTLHSVLDLINTPERKIWTAEDPVEITQYRLRQVQINPKIGLTFASAMRAFLRADPDVIMVGEMRDQETAKIAIEASLTGHLVFSTLHTNSAPETITRLVDMGMDPFNFADALLGIAAQRLLSTLCAKCKRAYHPSQMEYDRLKEIYGPTFDLQVNIPYLDDLRLYSPAGCNNCNNSGYKGRKGIFELLIATKAIKQSIIEKARVDSIKELAQQEGMTTLIQEGIIEILSGHADLKQLVAVCSQ